MSLIRWRNIRYKLRYHYWQLVRRINLKAYLRHEIDCDPEGNNWELREWLMCIETDEYMKRAARVHVSLSDIPIPEKSMNHWKTADDGERYLPYNTLLKLKKMVEDAEYERDRRRRESNELRIKYFTALAAGIAAVSSFINLYLSVLKK
jgi:hypothetical protein